MAFSTVTVTVDDLTAAGQPATGTITLTPTEPFSNGTVEVAQVGVPMTVTAGSGSLTLFPNDDPGTTPHGTGYTVREELDGAPLRLRTVYLSHLTPTVDLNTL